MQVSYEAHYELVTRKGWIQSLGMCSSVEESEPYTKNRSPRDDALVRSRPLLAYKVPLRELDKGVYLSRH